MSDTVRAWRHISQRYNLIGSKCTTCGETFFPSRTICPNCRRKGKLEPFTFSGKGKIHTFSVINTPPSQFKKIAPYIVAIVDLDEGARVTSQVVDASPDEIKIGDEVEMVFRKIDEEGEGGVISYGFKFRLRK